MRLALEQACLHICKSEVLSDHLYEHCATLQAKCALQVPETPVGCAFVFTEQTSRALCHKSIWTGGNAT
jgi:hypothetical protein